MNLIQPKVEQIIQVPGNLGMYKHIEFGARLCYRTEDRITDTSYLKFLKMLKANQHLSVFEHGTIYLEMPEEDYDNYDRLLFRPNNSSIAYLGKVRFLNKNVYITTNFRRVIDWPTFPFNQYKVDKPSSVHDKRYSFLITTSRDVSHQIVRHRVFSYSQESQRYCNYSKRGMLFIDDPLIKECEQCPEYQEELKRIEELYNTLLKSNKPEVARKILPNITATKLLVTGAESDWEGFFKLRVDPHAQYDIQLIAKEIKSLLNKNK